MKLREILSAESVLFCVCFLMALNLFALDSEIKLIDDDSALRQRLAQGLFIDPPSSIIGNKPKIERLDSGSRVEVRIEQERGSAEFSTILAREHDGRFPGWAQGSFILIRNTATGAAERIRVFLRSDPYTYIQFRPLNNEKSEMDVVIYDALLVQSLPISVPFKRLLVTSLNDVLEMAGPKFPRRYFEPEPDNYRDTRALITEIRRKIRPLQFGDDGAIDENGAYVFINDLTPQTATSGLNCSGFAKWVIDGLLRPVTQSRLAITPLKQPYGERGTSFTNPYERLRDPYFGLDWIRNLAAEAGTIFKSPEFAALEEIEVQQAPFQAILARNGKSSAVKYYAGHLPNAGFSFEGIQSILYTLAIDEPDNFFLGAISREGGKPALRTYFHIVVLFPYFDEDKVFHIAIFESAEETSFARFKVRYPSHHINLCRIPIETAFDP